MRAGLLETVGVDCQLVIDDYCSITLNLPEGTDTQLVARAIDLENVEAWLDESKKVHIAINPWYSTKDVDQIVLCAIEGNSRSARNSRRRRKGSSTKNS